MDEIHSSEALVSKREIEKCDENWYQQFMLYFIYFVGFKEKCSFWMIFCMKIEIVAKIQRKQNH